MFKLNALIAGSTGYIGIQLIKLLLKHKNINIKYLCGNSSVGKSISSYDRSFSKKRLPKIIKFNKKLLKHVDIIFTALPNGEAQEISNLLLKHNTLIDLAADFRLKKSSEYLKWYKHKHKSIRNIKNSIYSLPEICKKDLKDYNIISCPGCYPTSILLPIVPLMDKKLLNCNNIIIDSKSGYSGAGKKIHQKFKKKNLYNSLSAYGIGYHRHVPEIHQALSDYTKMNINLLFTPHLSPMFKGILSTIYLETKSGISLMDVTNTLKQFYSKSKFIKILKNNTQLSTNDVIDTNNCCISVCKTQYRNKIIILSAIDNLIKGGAGQAIQNMNLKFGFTIGEGLI